MKEQIRIFAGQDEAKRNELGRNVVMAALVAVGLGIAPFGTASAQFGGIMLGDDNASSALPVVPGNDEGTDELMDPPDSGFLLTMEAWQRRIAVLSLALRAAELEVQRAEQERRLRELEVETDSIDILAGLEGTDTAGLGPMLQAGMDTVRRAADETRRRQEAREEEIAPPPPSIQVLRIQGLDGDLEALVSISSGGTTRVKAGDVLPGGRTVVEVRQSNVMVREASGMLTSIGLYGS